jgi:hypothetical protein
MGFLADTVTHILAGGMPATQMHHTRRFDLMASSFLNMQMINHDHIHLVFLTTIRECAIPLTMARLWSLWLSEQGGLGVQ